MHKDTAVFGLIEKERERQVNGIELIASENFASKQVMKAMGSVLTNKYAEGLPFKRYYGGCEVVDQLEQLAIDRLKELYGAAWANVQPHSGAQANAAVMLACCYGKHNDFPKLPYSMYHLAIYSFLGQTRLCPSS